MFLRLSIRCTLLLAFATGAPGTRAQFLFLSDQFNGGVLSGGFAKSTMSFGSGSFTMPVPPGATIRTAWFFAGRLGNAAATTVTLNGDPWTFDNTNVVGPVWTSQYGGPSAVHAIDVTATISPLTTNYTIDVPMGAGGVSNAFSEYYLVILYDLPGASPVSVDLWLGAQDAGPLMPYNLTTTYPMDPTVDIGLCIVGGYASASTDCEHVVVNGTQVGTFWGPDFNSVDPIFGSMGSMHYVNGTLAGLGDDDPNQAILASDVLSNINALVPNGSTALNVDFIHCSGSGQDNHVWIVLLAHGAAACDVVLELGPDTTLCTGSTLLLDATQNVAATHLWHDGSTGPTFLVTTAGTYFVEVTSATCTRSDTIVVTFATPPVFSLGNDTTLCPGATLLLDATANPPGTTTWHNGQGGATLQVNGPGTYWAVVDNNGCARSDTLVVTAAPAPPLVLPPSVGLCIGSSLVLDAGSPTLTYLWNTGATTHTLSVPAPGTYSVSISNGSCTVQDTTVVQALNPPAVDLGPDTAYCQTQPVVINAGPGASYLWSTGATSPSITLANSATVWVVVTDANGCSSADTVSIQLNAPPVVQLPNTTTCIGLAITLDAGNPGATYQWSTGENTRTISVTGPTGTVEVTVTNAAGCTTTGQAMLTFIPPPVVDLPTDTSACDGEVITLAVNAAGAQVVWSTGATTPAIAVTQPGAVTVTLDNGFCTRSDSTLVVFHPLPQPVPFSEQVICLDHPPQAATLDAGNPGCTYAWSTGGTERFLVVSDPGTYEVLLTTPFGCTGLGTIRVIDFCPPQLFVPNVFTPDGDGINDGFMPVGEGLMVQELLIFDRWGALIHRGQRDAVRWDGTVQGFPAPDGVYVWRLIYRGIEDHLGRLSGIREAMGHVTLLR